MNELKNERDIIIKVLDGQILLKEASKILGIHKETVNSRIIELAKIDEEIRQKFIKYCKRNNFENINFLVLFREMLEKDCSQSFIASQYDIPTRTISREIEKLKKLEGYESVYSVLKEHAERHIKRRLDKRSLTKEEQKEEYNYEIQLESVLDILPKGEVFTYIDTEDMLSKGDVIEKGTTKHCKLVLAIKPESSYISSKTLTTTDRFDLVFVQK